MFTDIKEANSKNSPPLAPQSGLDGKRAILDGVFRRLRGVGGYGSTSIYHTEKILRLSQDLPIVIESVEYEDRIEHMLPRLDEMIGGGLITLEKVRVILYRSTQEKGK